MKTTILFCLLLLIILFSYPTKLKHKNKNSRINQENTILMNVQNRIKFDSEEDWIKSSCKLSTKKNIQNPIKIVKNKNPLSLSSRHKKGKILYCKNQTIIPKTKLK